MFSSFNANRPIAALLACLAILRDIVLIPIRAAFTWRRPAPAGHLFASLTVEANVLTKRRLEQFAYGLGLSALSVDLMTALMSHLVQRLGEKRVQCLAIANLTDDVNDLDGTGIAGSIRVYAIILKKQATATAAYWKLFDDATNSGTATDGRVTISLLESGKEAILIFPDGLSLTDGIVQTAQTTVNGTVDSTSGDGPNGLMVVG